MRIAAIAVVNPCTTSKEQYSFKLPSVATTTATGYGSSTTPAVSTFELNNTKNPDFSWTSLKYDSLNAHDYTHALKLGNKWKEYQGINNWEGLLDPLDDNLRDEILRYGQFVEAAYRACDFDPSSPSYGTSKFPRRSLLTRSGIGETGYRVIESLKATCGIQLPRWIHKSPSCIWRQSSWIGYVAVCQDKDEIARLGRRDVVIAFRGTATRMEWIENLRATLTPLPDNVANVDPDPKSSGGAMVESGFLSLYTSSTAKCPSLQDMVRKAIAKVLKIYGNQPLSITVTGHSLGAALATLTAYDINSTFSNAPMVTVISFGGPRVGNQSFRCRLEKSGTRVLRIVNSDDLITKVPGFVIDNNDVADRGTANVAGFPSWLQKRVEDTQWVYADVGQELRLSSKDCPHLSKGNVATCHELSTYLRLVNAYVSSKCPFRDNLKYSRQKLERLVEV